MADAAISVRGLRKSYGRHEAVRGIDFEVQRGEVFGFFGPNGAGKTTTIEILEGYRDRTGGDVSVLGVDPGRSDRTWRNRIGLVLQECQLDPTLTVREPLPDWLQQIGRLFPLYHLADGLQNTFFPRGGGIGLQGSNVTSLLVWGLAGLIVAVRRFKWEPQGPGHS